MLRIKVAIAAMIFLGSSVWADEYSDFVKTCEDAIHSRKKCYRSDAYIEVPVKLYDEKCLKEALDEIQKIFGTEIQMRIYNQGRVQIWWEGCPHLSPTEFLHRTIINTLDPWDFGYSMDTHPIIDLL